MIQAQVTRLVAAVMLTLVGFCGITVAQEETVLSDQMLPKETFFYLSVPDTETLKEAFASSTSGKMWADPAFDDFRKELQTAFESEVSEGVAKVQEALGLSLEELLAIPVGEVSLAISGAPGNKMGAAMFLDFGSHQSEVETLLAKAVAALSQAPSLRQANATVDGTELTLFNVTADIAKKTPLAKEFGWFVKDERLVISNSRALMEAVLANWEGNETDSLQANEIYSYIMEKCGSEDGDHLITMYFDPIGLFSKVIQTGSAGEAGLGAGMALGFLPTLGLNQMKAMGSVAQMNVDGFEGVSRSFIYTEQPPNAAMRIFMLDQVDPVPPAWVKEGASMYMATKWQVAEAYSAIESLVDMFQGAGALAGIVDNLATQGPQVHIRNDVIDQLDGNLQMVSAPGGESSAAGSDQMLFAIGVRDSKKMAELLAKLTSQPGFPGETREFQGATLYEIDPGTGQKIGFTVANNKLLIGVGGDLLDQALRNDEDVRPLAETDAFRKVAEHFRPNALAVTYTHPAAQYRSLYDLLKSGNAADNFPGMDELFERIDFTRLPDFEVIEKYMAPAGGSWVADENGVLMETFSLKPTE
jgi:hypothetical protein